MGLFTSSKSWGAQMKAAKKGTKTAREAKADAHKKNNPTEFKRRKDAARGKR